ncbi:MAG: aminomethyltransferase beta-barrel domain-containing protein [Planctomycetaceae bacterium]
MRTFHCRATQRRGSRSRIRFCHSHQSRKSSGGAGLREDLATKSIRVHQLNWLADRPGDSFRCEVKVRYRQASESCTVQVEDDQRAMIIPDVSIFSVAPGQAAVLCNGDQVLG